MPENILIAIAWPYANSEIHVGNITGSHLPGDIVARYHRLKGDQVLMVSGTDSHGTPVTIAADKEGKPVEEVYKKFHNGFLDLFQQMGITYDLFTTTHTENHFKVSQSIFLALQKNGFLYTQKSMQWYSPAAEKFLPDRYVEGTCYICGFEGARSDQCDNCGNVLEPEKLINPRSKVDGSTPELRETEHFYLDLSKLEPDVVEFLRQRSGYMRDTVMGESLRKIEAEGLKPRPITRDLDWGIPVPVEGWDGKCLYVWFEAVIGYLSAAIEWARVSGDPRGLEGLVDEPGCKGLLFHWQGQHLLPYRHVAGRADGRRRAVPADLRRGGRHPDPALRCARQPVHEPGRPEDLRPPQLGRLGTGCPHPLRSRPAALLPDHQHAREPRFRLGLGRIRRPEQQRAGGHLGQPGQPCAVLLLQTLGWACALHRPRYAAPG